ncbi:MAG: hypothetical protein GWP08_11685 [Nitrospiraceae bacterium]|nr:hypothetical protein [Nitrospiraceae bacterium]
MPRRRISAIHGIVGLWILVLLGVLATVYFAPDKPEAPPESVISYEQRPERSVPTRPDQRSGRRPAPVETEEPVEVKVAVEAADGPVIWGTVTDAESHKPVVRAKVVCVPRMLGMEQTQQAPVHTFTDKQGRYALRVDGAGAYRLAVSHMAYIALDNESCVLEEGDKKVRRDFVLSRGARIEGRVTESGTNQGAQGIDVYAAGGRRTTVRTNERGEYILAGLVPGRYTVTLGLRGAAYLSAGMAPTRDVSIADPGQVVRGVDFRVEVAGQVWGYVVTQKGDPMANVDVVLCTGESLISQAMDAAIKQAPPLLTRSREDGYFELIGVPLNREWHLYASSEFSAPQLSAPFVLTDRQRVARVDLFCAPGTTVFGRVVSTDRKPIAKADVLCIPSYSSLFSSNDAPKAFRPTRSDENGRFEIVHLPAGEYQVVARKDGYKFAATGEPIHPNGYRDIANVEVVLEPVDPGEHTVFGRVTDASGRAIPGARLDLAMMSMSDLREESEKAETDAKGEYAFFDISAGFLMLSCRKPGYQSKNVTNVRLDEPTDIVLEGTCSVEGLVLVKETGESAAGAQVTAMPSGDLPGGGLLALMEGGTGGARVSEEGRFRLEIAPGSYTLEASRRDLTPGRADVSVAAGEQLDGVTIYMRESGGKISGRVTTADGGSPQGALVWLSGGAGGTIGALPILGAGPEGGVQVGYDGTFELTQLAAGRYTVMARHNLYAQGQSGPHELADGETLSGVEVRLGMGGTLEGYVTMDGQLQEGAIVTVIADGAPKTGSTDVNGQYRIERLQPGTHQASALSLRAASLTNIPTPIMARVEIVEGQTTTYNFGEATNTALVGLCEPPPAPGTRGFAMLLAPGSGLDINNLNLLSMMGMFQNVGAASLPPFLVGVEPDGFFRVDGLVEGDFELHVFYGSAADLMNLSPQPVFSGAVHVVDGETTDLGTIPVSER